MLFHKIHIIKCVIAFLVFSFLQTNSSFANDETNRVYQSNKPTFYYLRSEIATINQNEFFDFLRMSIIQQPEYSYAMSDVVEKKMLLKFQQRHRYPDLSLRLINDKVLSRDVDDFSSIRKRQDDSFDIALEINQPIYTGGSISSRIKMARIEYMMSNNSKSSAFSELILDASTVYLSAIKADFLYSYGSNILEELKPYLEKVRDRVNIGISDPVELAIFSIKFNSLSSRVQKLRTDRNRDIAIFEYFFKAKFDQYSFPEVFVPKIQFDNNESYEVKNAKLGFENSKSNINLTKSEFRPQFGFNARYTSYDIDDNQKKDHDIRGGVFFSMPIFTFGRASSKISSAKAMSNAKKMTIGIEKKADEAKESELVNIVENSQSIREDLIKSFNDTKYQREIISDRLDVVSFSADALVNSYTEELSMLESILNTEQQLLQGYFMYLHQNKILLANIGINP
tara:strand:+ start:946 stop:2307 length:1362 start_codon:yes stop_codon:yes gene_type:complete